MIKLSELLGKCNECGRDWNHGHDHEAGMAKNELRDMISNASKIDSMVGESDNLPGWVSAYISLAADYMHSVAEYLGGESSREEEAGPGYAMYEAKKKKGIKEEEFGIGAMLMNAMSPLEAEELENFYNILKNEPIIVKAEYKSDFIEALKKLIMWRGKDSEVGQAAYKIISMPNSGHRYGPDKIEQVLDYIKSKRGDFGSRGESKFGYGMMEAKKKKPSAGLTKKQKSDVVKKAKAGEDIGKKGKGFEDVAKEAGGGKKGQKIAAAAMWKNVKRK